MKMDNPPRPMPAGRQALEKEAGDFELLFSEQG